MSIFQAHRTRAERASGHPLVVIIGVLCVAAVFTSGWFWFDRGLAKPTKTPTEALDRLVADLRRGDMSALRRDTAGTGFGSLQQAAVGYVEKYHALGDVLARMRPYIQREGWAYSDSSHAWGGVSWRGGSGRHTDQIEMQKTAAGWKLAQYRRIWDR